MSYPIRLARVLSLAAMLLPGVAHAKGSSSGHGHSSTSRSGSHARSHSPRSHSRGAGARSGHRSSSSRVAAPIHARCSATARSSASHSCKTHSSAQRSAKRPTAKAAGPAQVDVNPVGLAQVEWSELTEEKFRLVLTVVNSKEEICKTIC
jgi:hypothetical protein